MSFGSCSVRRWAIWWRPWVNTQVLARIATKRPTASYLVSQNSGRLASAIRVDLSTSNLNASRGYSSRWGAYLDWNAVIMRSALSRKISKTWGKRVSKVTLNWVASHMRHGFPVLVFRWAKHMRWGKESLMRQVLVTKPKYKTCPWETPR